MPGVSADVAKGLDHLRGEATPRAKRNTCPSIKALKEHGKIIRAKVRMLVRMKSVMSGSFYILSAIYQQQFQIVGKAVKQLRCS